MLAISAAADRNAGLCLSRAEKWQRDRQHEKNQQRDGQYTAHITIMA
jgi:hypothetical protein